MLERTGALKSDLIQFVLEAEGELATALETYTAAEAKRGKRFDMTQRQRLIDLFLTAGQVGNATPLDLFVEQHPDLSEGDRDLVLGWHRSFMGLFEVEQDLDGGLVLFNWLTAKSYRVYAPDPEVLTEINRHQPGEMALTQIAPLSNERWVLFGPCTWLGKLGKPKLAVAIGNFKQDYKAYLYSDAPELLAAAWESVAQYHQEFVDFFGSDQITLPGYQLNQKLAAFQDQVTQKHLTAAGIDSSQSFTEMATASGLSPAEMEAALLETGASQQQVAQVLEPQRSLKMVLPKVELPDHLKQAEQVTVLAHPRWGQALLPTYHRLQTLLETEPEPPLEPVVPLIRHYLENPGIHALVWYRLAEAYPAPLERLLQQVLERPKFDLDRDLDALLQEFGKPLEPELPEIASVPMHLHNLFQAALAEVQKSKPKGKKKKSTGFGATRA